MTRHLTIAIDANRVTCGKCEWLRDVTEPNWVPRASCDLFLAHMGKGHSGFRRCAPCLAAEREAGE